MKKTFVPADYQHETDRALMEKLANSDAMESVKKFLADNHIEAVFNYYYRSSYIRVTREMSPKLADMLERGADMFGLSEPPVLYLTRDFNSGASVSGVSEPFILISTDLLSRVESDRMLENILASMCAGIAAGHSSMNYLMWIVDRIAELLPIKAIPLPEVLKQAITGTAAAGLHKWAQWRTFTLDRAFYLASGDIRLSVEQIMLQKMSNGNKSLFALGTREDKYLPQKDAFIELSGAASLAQAVDSFLQDDAWLPVRYNELMKFAEGRSCV